MVRRRSIPLIGASSLRTVGCLCDASALVALLLPPHCASIVLVRGDWDHAGMGVGASVQWKVVFGVFGACAVTWMAARVWLQARDIRSSPQVYSSLVLLELERLKPFTRSAHRSRGREIPGHHQPTQRRTVRHHPQTRDRGAPPPTAPYLHDGSAAMLMDVLRIHRDDRHGMTSQLHVVAGSEPKVGSCQPRVRAKRSSRSRPFSILARLVA
jgi:hypothetical protein